MALFWHAVTWDLFDSFRGFFYVLLVPVQIRLFPPHVHLVLLVRQDSYCMRTLSNVLFLGDLFTKASSSTHCSQLGVKPEILFSLLHSGSSLMVSCTRRAVLSWSLKGIPLWICRAISPCIPSCQVRCPIVLGSLACLNYNAVSTQGDGWVLFGFLFSPLRAGNYL